MAWRGPYPDYRAGSGTIGYPKAAFAAPMNPTPATTTQHWLCEIKGGEERQFLHRCTVATPGLAATHDDQGHTLYFGELLQRLTFVRCQAAGSALRISAVDVPAAG